MSLSLVEFSGAVVDLCLDAGPKPVLSQAEEERREWELRTQGYIQ